jgi:type II secretory pathway component PulF
LAPLLLALAAEALLGLLHYAGLSRRNAPIVGRLCRRPDNALIMRWLAIAVRQERPIGEIVRLLAGSFPQPAVRAKLQRAARRIDQGADWRESLRRERLIDRLEAAVFQSAERVGNLAWALDEMADSCARRAAYRMRARLNVAFPVVVLAFGGCVFLILAGILMPLFSLI